MFDLRGQKIATLVNEFTKPGAYSITWDAAKIASGVYFVHFTATGEGMAAVSQIQKEFNSVEEIDCIINFIENSNRGLI